MPNLSPFSKEQAKEEIKALVERFSKDIDVIKNALHGKEAQIEDTYIKPLFHALNWNVTNAGLPFSKHEFVVQASQRRVTGYSEPDYLLQLPDDTGRMKKWLFVEAKHPKHNLKTELKSIRQAYQYAHSTTGKAQDPERWVRLALLTDFEEFRLFDCVDSAPLKIGNEHLFNKCIVQPFEWQYQNYVTDFDILWDVFEREHVSKGSLKSLQVTKDSKIKNRVPPDEHFLNDIKDWRKEIATSMWRLNREDPNFNDNLLASATQLIIDRLVFIKMLSDKGIEPDYLSQMLSDLGKLGDSNVALFQECKSRFSFLNTLYNGTIFSERAELDAMPVENKVLIEILKELDPEYAPYTLASLDVRIIGNAYEQYLGEVIHSDGRGVKVEKKSEVVKAKGVYYTPGYIVEYIVENTLGKLLKNCKSPEDVIKLKILDPACGSGSFLFTAYDFILHWYQDYFVKERKVEKKYREFAEVIKLPDGGVVRLTAKLRRDILLNNIYGVDIDPQAVEVAQFSLCMKALEGVEDRKELETERNLFKQTILPDMSRNIKCGNSLIGTDIYNEDLFSCLDSPEKRKINAFDWEHEFTEIFNRHTKGFDAVIGNPPWIFTREIMTEVEKGYYRDKFSNSFEKMNTYMLFMELLLRLSNMNSLSGFIVPNSWLTIDSAKKLRPALIPYLALLVDLNYKVFEKVSAEPSIFVLTGKSSVEGTDVARIFTPSEINNISYFNMDKEKWEAPNYRLTLTVSSREEAVVDKILGNSKKIGEIYDVRCGLQAYEKGKGKPPQSQKDVDEHIYDRIKKDSKDVYMYLQGKDVRRYGLKWSGQWLKYGSFLSQPRELKIFSSPRILIREITGKFPQCICAAFANDIFLNNKSVLNILSFTDDEDELLYLLAILNSKTTSFYYKQKSVKSARKLFPKIVVNNLKEFPIPILDITNIEAERIFNKIVSLTCNLNSLYVAVDGIALQHEKERVKKKLPTLTTLSIK